jgi:hypothetical protein
MSTGQQYEFTESQNDLIGRLAYKMRGVGVFFAVIGFIYIGLAVLTGVLAYNKLSGGEVATLIMVYGLGGLVYAAVGIWTRQGAAEFRKIVDTRGSDITHLMNALDSLHKLYSLIYTIIMVVLVALVAIFAMAVIMGLGR